MARQIYPIFEDLFLDLGTNPTGTFEIKKGGATLYAGTAVRRPGETNIRVKINNILENYLGQEYPSAVGTSPAPRLLFDCEILINGAGRGGLLTSYDWSYDRNLLEELDQKKAGVLLMPIQKKISPKQDLFFTKIDDQDALRPTTITKVYIDDTTNVETIPGSPSAFNYHSRALEDFPSGKKLKQLIINAGDINAEQVFEVTAGCEEFVLYYVNEIGGWDWMLCEGRGVQEDEYNRHTHKQEYNNRLEWTAGKVQYLNEITKTLRLRTGLMSGREGRSMHRLLSSPLVYLADLRQYGFNDQREFKSPVPVIITDSSCTYKTYKNNGATLYDYEIGVEVARDYKRQ